MNRIYQIALFAILLFGYPCATFAQDTTFNRVVTVERDYQPEVQAAQAISTTPTFIQYTPQLNPVVYSTYSEPLSIGYNLHALPPSETHFSSPTPLNGIVEGALGHRNTHLLFGYRIKYKKKMSLDLYANHDAYWGSDALSESRLGLQATRHFSSADLYFGVEGENEAYAYLPAFDWQTLWNANAKIGIRSSKNDAIQYRIQTGYNAFFATNYAIEHQVRSNLDFTWQADYHKAGIKAYIQNSFYSITDTTSAAIAPRHAIRIEPFYEFKNKHILVHAGVNINMNIGCGTMLSSIENLSFAPSPNLTFEWHMMDNIFHLYANAQGHYGLGTLEEYLGYNRYLNIPNGLQLNKPRTYTPVDAQIGVKIRPLPTLLIDIYGGYAYLYNAYNMEAILDKNGIPTDYTLWLKDFQRWKVGASLHYHYRDIVEFNAEGNYYFYQQNPIPSMDPNDPYFQENRIKGTKIFDRPNWDLKARLDVHIDSKWSIYSDNYFAGSRWAYTSEGDKQIKPIISLNIGGQYAINRWLMVYLQLNDYINRKDEIFYGFQSQGIHFLLGAKYKF